mmetsp:Transcript_48358/g.144392  ORF Transcript_48358/g.144392 Transcript_48358/m.144392 type:complete len:296 (-) Transcript_48358:104-991(-)
MALEPKEAAEAPAVASDHPEVAACGGVQHLGAEDALSALPEYARAQADHEQEAPASGAAVEAPTEPAAGPQAAGTSAEAAAQPPSEGQGAAEAAAEDAPDAFADADFARESSDDGSSDDSDGPPLDAYWSSMLNVTRTAEPLQPPRMTSSKDVAPRERGRGHSSVGKGGASTEGRSTGKSDYKGKGTRSGKVGMYYVNPMGPMNPTAPIHPMVPMNPMALLAAGGKGLAAPQGGHVVDSSADQGRQRSRSPRGAADNDDLRNFLSASREEADEETLEHRTAQDEKINDSIKNFLV